MNVSTKYLLGLLLAVLMLPLGADAQLVVSESWSRVPSWFAPGSVRGADYHNGIFYAADRGNSTIQMMSGATGEDIAPDVAFDLSSVSGGLFPIQDVEVTDDGYIMVCNMTLDAQGAGNPFKVYAFDPAGGAPIASKTIEFSNIAGRLGDKFYVKGSLLDNTVEVWASVSSFASDGEVVRFTTADQGETWTADQFIMSGANTSTPANSSLAVFGEGATAEFYISGNGQLPRRHSLNGLADAPYVASSQFPNDDQVGYSQNNGMHAVSFEGRDYLVIYSYRPAGITAGNKTGRVAVVDVTDPTAPAFVLVTPLMGPDADTFSSVHGSVTGVPNADGSWEFYAMDGVNGFVKFVATSPLAFGAVPGITIPGSGAAAQQAITMDGNGRLWVGSYNGGAIQVWETTGVNYTPSLTGANLIFNSDNDTIVGLGATEPIQFVWDIITVHTGDVMVSVQASGTATDGYVAVLSKDDGSILASETYASLGLNRATLDHGADGVVLASNFVSSANESSILVYDDLAGTITKADDFDISGRGFTSRGEALTANNDLHWVLNEGGESVFELNYTSEDVPFEAVNTYSMGGNVNAAADLPSGDLLVVSNTAGKPNLEIISYLTGTSSVVVLDELPDGIEIMDMALSNDFSQIYMAGDDGLVYTASLSLPGAPSNLAVSNEASNSVDVSFDGAAGASSYVVQVANDVAFTDVVANVALASTSGTIEGLLPQTTYNYRVFGLSTGEGLGGTASAPGTFTTILGPPTLNDVADYATDGFTVSWTPITGVTNYEYDLATDETFTTFVASQEAQTTTQSVLTFTGLTANTEYFFRVRSQGQDDPNDYSTLSATTLEDLTEAPTIAAESDVSFTQFTANWTAPATDQGLTAYQVEYSDAADFNTTLGTITTADATVTSQAVTINLGGAVPLEGTYYYRVRGVKDLGDEAGRISATAFTAGEEVTIDPLPFVTATAVDLPGITVYDYDANDNLIEVDPTTIGDGTFEDGMKQAGALGQNQAASGTGMVVDNAGNVLTATYSFGIGGFVPADSTYLSFAGITGITPRDLANAYGGQIIPIIDFITVNGVVTDENVDFVRGIGRDDAGNIYIVINNSNLVKLDATTYEPLRYWDGPISLTNATVDSQGRVYMMSVVGNTLYVLEEDPNDATGYVVVAENPVTDRQRVIRTITVSDDGLTIFGGMSENAGYPIGIPVYTSADGENYALDYYLETNGATYGVQVDASGGLWSTQPTDNPLNGATLRYFDPVTAEGWTVEVSPDILQGRVAVDEDELGWDVYLQSNSNNTIHGYRVARPLPDAPVALDVTAGDVVDGGFTARWTPVAEVDGYVIDVARDQAFTNFVPGYEALSVTANSADITGLPETGTYYFRVRAVAGNLESENSNVVSVSITVTGSTLATLQGLNLYPNPASRTLTISASERFDEVAVRGMDGRLVALKAVGAMSTQLDFSELASGIYLVSVTADDRTQTVRIVKQ